MLYYNLISLIYSKILIDNGLYCIIPALVVWSLRLKCLVEIKQSGLNVGLDVDFWFSSYLGRLPGWVEKLFHEKLRSPIVGEVVALSEVE